MKTYKTYQECKIANPECEVAKFVHDNGIKDYMNDGLVVGSFTPVVKDENKRCGYAYADSQADGSPNITDGCWKICNPADHCMSVKEFLGAGYRFEVGDALLFPNDVEQVQIVGSTACHACFIDVDAANCRSMVDHKIYILRAVALESRPLKQYAVLYKGGSYSFQSDKPVGDDIVACFDLSHSEKPLSGDFFEEKPRTKVEYVKVGFRAKWEYVKLMEDTGESLFFLSNEGFIEVMVPESAIKKLREGHDLYRRIETQMTEREAFIATLNELHDEYGALLHEDVSGSLFDYIADSGKFKLVN